jgi:hypothetical protein
VHGGAHKVYAERHEWIVVIVEGIAEGWRKQDCSGWSGLMMVVNNLRKPLVIENAVDCFRFRLRSHVEVTIVIVTYILLIKPRHTRSRPFCRIRFTHVPVGNQIHSVRVDANGQENHVFQEARGLSIVQANHLIDQLHQLLRAEHFRGMQTSIDPDDCLALRCQRTRLLIR